MRLQYCRHFAMATVIMTINDCFYFERQIIQHENSKMAELEIDNSDDIVQKVKKFMRETCGCALG